MIFEDDWISALVAHYSTINNISNHFLSCYYNRNRSCILLATITRENRKFNHKTAQYIGGEKHLHILLCEEPTFVNIGVMAEILKKQRIKPFINKHEPLRWAMGGELRCTEIDFENEHKSELPALNDLYESLKDEGRIHLLENMDLKKPNIRYALNLILKASVEKICR